MTFLPGFALFFVLFIYEGFGIQPDVSYSGHGLLFQAIAFGGLTSINFFINEFVVARWVSITKIWQRILWHVWEIWMGSLLTFLLFNYFWNWTEWYWSGYLLIVFEYASVVIFPILIARILARSLPKKAPAFHPTGKIFIPKASFHLLPPGRKYLFRPINQSLILQIMKYLKITFTFLFLTASFLFLSASFAQPVVGFWEIEEVKVGSETMTPAARWTRINKDGTYQSGNGWLQHAEGSWTYDESKKTFLPQETSGVADEFGAFTVERTGETMTWQREEEGMTVRVTFKPIEALPKATADYLTGLWELKEVVRQEANITAAFDPDHQHYIFFRWDRIYVERTPAGERGTGYWHINGHRPEITLLSHRHGQAPESWKISATEDELRMTGISDANREMVRVYRRIHQFPQ